MKISDERAESLLDQWSKAREPDRKIFKPADLSGVSKMNQYLDTAEYNVERNVLTLKVKLRREFGGRVSFLHGGFNFFIMQFALRLLASLDKNELILQNVKVSYLNKIPMRDYILVKAKIEGNKVKSSIFDLDATECCRLEGKVRTAKF